MQQNGIKNSISCGILNGIIVQFIRQYTVDQQSTQTSFQLNYLKSTLNKRQLNQDAVASFYSPNGKKIMNYDFLLN